MRETVLVPQSLYAQRDCRRPLVAHREVFCSQDEKTSLRAMGAPQFDCHRIGMIIKLYSN
eukprot:1047807-Prorocentrum_minimum.AAC.1